MNIKNEKGYSLAELVVSLPLAVFAIALLTFAIINFTISYQETQLYIQLQEDLFSAIETMRYGYTKANVTDGEQIIGLASANKVEIGLTDNSIKIIPIILHTGIDYYARFYENEGKIIASAQYGVKSFNNIRVFPESDRMFGTEPMFEILNLQFVPEKTIDGKIYLLGVNASARVRFRMKKDEQSLEEDLRENTKTIHYKTSIFIGNAQIQNTES